MVTMADVGRLAGVSASTVSHVLNGTRSVSDAARQQVLAAISTTGYRHNIMARALARSSSMTLGLAISSVANPYFGEAIRSIEERARAAGYMVLLADTFDDADVERRVVEQLVDRRVDGVLLAPSPGAPDGALPFLQSVGVPTVLVDRFLDADVDQVAPENVEATARLAEHLADLGHTRIAMLAGLPGLASSTERVAGYTRVVRQRGLADDLALLLEGASRAATAEAAVLALFRDFPPPTAVLPGNNAMTIGTMRALRTLGLRVPQDVALACYDDFAWADLFEPRLTAMGQDVVAMARQSIDLLVRRMARPDAPCLRQRVPPVYAHRTSCGCSGDAVGGSA